MIPRIELTDAAAAALADATRELADDARCVRVFVDEQWRHGLDVGPRAGGDIEIPTGAVTLLCPAALADRLDGLVIDYVAGGGPDDASGFRLDNPNAPADVRPISPRELRARLEAGEPLLLLDVRTAREVDIASLPGARRVDVDDLDELTSLAPDTALVFACHHGVRSHAAARYFATRGFRRVYNLTGGIDAWSVDVDPSVPRY